MTIQEMRQRIKEVFAGVKHNEIARKAKLSTATVHKFMKDETATTETVDKLYAAAVEHQKSVGGVEL